MGRAFCTHRRLWTKVHRSREHARDHRLHKTQGQELVSRTGEAWKATGFQPGQRHIWAAAREGAGLSFVPIAAQLLNPGRRGSAAATTASLQSVRAGVGTESPLETAQQCPLAGGREIPVPQDHAISSKLRG